MWNPIPVHLLNKLRYENLEHPPYSPDLSPCDYLLIEPLKENLRKTFEWSNS